MLAVLRSSGFEGWLSRLAMTRPRLLAVSEPSVQLAIVVLLVLLFALQYRLWVGEGSLAQLHGLEQEIAVQEEELVRLRARNQELQAEVADRLAGLNAFTGGNHMLNAR
ncbi:MAG: septum formation initiator family protein [Sphingobacteriia bacterium]|nr:septum formation initiator family protein [Sphingobacteriia bacterium]